MKNIINILRISKLFLMLILILISLFLTSCHEKYTDSGFKVSNEDTTSSLSSDLSINTPDPEKEDLSTNKPVLEKENISKKIIQSFNEYKDADFSLTTEIPEKNIYLYADKSSYGTVLCVNGARIYFDWYTLLTPRNVFPQIYSYDFTNNGIDEIAIVRYVGSGTGVSIDELRIIEILDDSVYSKVLDDNQTYKLNSKHYKEYCYENYTSQLNEEVKLNTYYKNNQLIADIEISNELYSVNLDEFQERFEYKNVEFESGRPIFGSIVSFNFEDNKLKAVFGLGLGLFINNSPYPLTNYIGDVIGDVKFENGEFSLKNIYFQPHYTCTP
ncbi:UNVERIFIED_CONTAM: hypothetical protein Cloal_0111 [Acetivibrio alkalicellulosi]